MTIGTEFDDSVLNVRFNIWRRNIAILGFNLTLDLL